MLRTGVDLSAISAFKIKKFLRAKGIAAYKIPDEIEIVDVF